MKMLIALLATLAVCVGAYVALQVAEWPTVPETAALWGFLDVTLPWAMPFLGVAGVACVRAP